MYTSLSGMLTHKTLAATLPFYCCWLVDIEDVGKPCTPSVALASLLFSARHAQFAPDDTVWLN